MFIYLLIAANEKRSDQFSKNSEFSDVFGESSNDLQKYSSQYHTGTSPFVPNKSDVLISNSLFLGCTSTTNGGAVSCTNSTSANRMLIEETTFVACKTTDTKGGGIYFSNEGNKVFYGEKSNCQITITNCTLDNDLMTSKRYTGPFTIISSRENSFINTPLDIVTVKCHSLLDSYGLYIVAPGIQEPQQKKTPTCRMMTLSCPKRHKKISVF